MNTQKTVQMLHGKLTKREILRRHIANALTAGAPTMFSLTDISKELEVSEKATRQIVTWLRDNLGYEQTINDTDHVIFGTTIPVVEESLAASEGSNI